MNARDRSVLASQVLIAGFQGRSAPGELLTRAARGELGGLILFKRNLGAMHEISALIAEVVRACPADMPPLSCVDQEGGRVARLVSPVLQLPPMRVLGAIDDPDLTFRAGALLGRQLGALGFNMDFAPVLDIHTNDANPVIGDRAFGTSADVVIRHARAFARGLREAHVLSCGKHFPGHGDTDLDSHLALPVLAHARERLEQIELRPFRELRDDLDAIMTAHIVFSSLSPEKPATLAAEVIDGLLKREIGYNGLVISDDLEMKAIADHYGVEQAACDAIAAGCDALLVCSRLDWLDRAAQALAARAAEDREFATRLEDAATRCLAVRTRHVPAPAQDPEALTHALDRETVQALEAEIVQRASRVG